MFTADADVFIWCCSIVDSCQELYLVRLPVVWGNSAPFCRVNAVLDVDVLDATRAWNKILAASSEVMQDFHQSEPRQHLFADVCAAITLAFGSDFNPPFCELSFSSLGTVLAHLKYVPALHTTPTHTHRC